MVRPSSPLVPPRSCTSCCDLEPAVPRRVDLDGSYFAEAIFKIQGRETKPERQLFDTLSLATYTFHIDIRPTEDTPMLSRRTRNDRKPTQTRSGRPQTNDGSTTYTKGQLEEIRQRMFDFSLSKLHFSRQEATRAARIAVEALRS